MIPESDMPRFEELLQLLLDEDLSGNDGAELDEILQGSPQARARYRTALRLHAALIRHPQPEKIVKLPKPARKQGWWIAGVAACALLGGWIALDAPRTPVATLTGTTAAVWKDDVTPGDLAGKRLELASGYAEIGYRSGARVILEGPCQFEVTSARSMVVVHGRATAKVPHTVHGFHLDTPAGRITDIGTEFGIAVGSGSDGPVVLTQVFDGEIEIPAEKSPRKRLHSGAALAIVGETGGTRLITATGGYQVNLADSARRLPAAAGVSPEAGNLALGKPVTSPAHYAMPHGNVFPPESLTDGRLNDSGNPGDWSFWLAPNGANGEFTVDLLDHHKIGRIELQNTRNRTYGDRGMRHFRVEVSDDGIDFTEIFRGELQRIAKLPAPGVGFPFETFTFPPVSTRYVKVTGLDHYSSLERPPREPNHGGGLNEIRIFAP